MLTLFNTLFEVTPYAIISAGTAIIALIVALVAWQRRTVPGGTSLALLMLAAGLWSGGAAFEYSALDPAQTVFWAQIEYFGGVTCPVFFLLFVLEYHRLERWLTPRVIGALFIVPAITLGLVLTNQWHGLIWPSLQVSLVNPHRIIYGHGFAFWLGAIGYSYLVLFLGSALLLQSALSVSSSYHRQVQLVVAGAVIPWVANVLTILGLSPVPDLDLTPLVMAVSGTLFAWAIFRFHLLQVLPVAHGLLIEKMLDGMIVLDAHHQIADVNPAAQAVLGMDKDSVISKTLEQLLPRLAEAVTQALGNQTFPIAIALQRNTTQRFFDVQVSPLMDANNQGLGYLVILRDVTERQHVEQALRESEAQLRALVDYSPASIIKFSPEGNILLWNAAAEKIYGWTASEVIGKPLPSVPTDKQSEKLGFQNQVNQGEVIPYTEVQRQRKDGSPIDVGLAVAPLKNEQGQVYAQMSISTDIGELKRAQAELARRAQTVALLEERARLGRDLHDSVTQLLYSVMLFADASKDAAQNADLDLTQQYLSRLSETARQALKELRLRVYELRPSVLEHEGLASALRHRLAQVEQRAGVQTDLNIALPHALPAPVELAIYWIAQEALNNALKHANATRIALALNADENSLRLEIADDGKGFDLDLLQEQAGVGMTSMRERARDLGGVFNITSAPGQGTRIQVTLPGYILAPAPTELSSKENKTQ